MKFTSKAYCRVVILGCDHLCFFLLMARLFKIIQIWFFFHHGLYPSLPWPVTHYKVPQPTVEGKPKPARSVDQKRTGNLFHKQTNPFGIHALDISTFTQYLLERLWSFLWHHFYIEQGYHTNDYINIWLLILWCRDLLYLDICASIESSDIFFFFIWMNPYIALLAKNGAIALKIKFNQGKYPLFLHPPLICVWYFHLFD